VFGGRRDRSDIGRIFWIYSSWIKIMACTGSGLLFRNYSSITTLRLIRARRFEGIYIEKDLVSLKIFRY